MTSEKLNQWRTELSVQAKNGIDFMLAAIIVWLGIAFIWTRDFTAYDKSIFVFMVGAGFMPLALLFSRILKTNWKVAGNPLQPLGLWLNFAQIFYFPFLVFVLMKMPEYFIMTYAIITGAHFFPYAWYYKTVWYAVFAGVISVGVLLIAFIVPEDNMYLIGLFTAASISLLAILLYADVLKKRKSQ